MKKVMLVVALLMVTGLNNPVMAKSHAKKGQKIFKKKFRKYCGFSGVRFARTHTQDEWEEIYDEDMFPSEAKKICPKLRTKRIKKSWWKPVYEFSYKYAKDGVIPKC